MIDSSVSEIKDRLDIVEVLSGYVKLGKAGRNFKALCPFHNEKSPSFMVNPERQIWHCFGCGEGGDIFTFVMKMDGLEFSEALRILAEKAGVEIKKTDIKFSGQRNKILDILEEAAGFYEHNLHNTDDGKDAYKYLIGRGISERSVKEWRIGFSPDDWRKSLEYLSGKGFMPADISLAGLAIEKTNFQGKSFGASAGQKHYDRFRGRIMFPIFDLAGKAVGFGARVFKGSTEKKDTAKYINTPQTAVYNKSKILYGLDKAKLAIGKANFCILVEGYTDVIASHQAGVKNVVSSSGTSLAIEQLRLIKRYTDNLVIAYDMDLAGEGATRRGIELALEEGFNIKVPRLPDNQDPADCIKENPEIWKEAIRNKKPILDYYFEDAFKRFDETEISGKKDIADFLMPVLAKVSNFIERNSYIKKLSARLDIDEKNLFDEIKKIKPEKSGGSMPREKIKDSFKKTMFADNTILLEEILIGLAVVFAEELKDIFLKIGSSVFSDTDLKEIADKLASYLKEKFTADGGGPLDEHAWLKEFLKILDYERRKRLNLLVFKTEEKYKEKGIDIEEEFNKVYANLMCQRLSAKLKNLENDIKKAEKTGDKDASRILSMEFMNISKEKNFFTDILINSNSNKSGY